LIGNYTLKNIQLDRSSGSSQKGEKKVILEIKFKSPDRKNFGKPNSDVEVDPIKMKFIQNWQLDEDHQTNEVVGAILQP